MKLAVAYKYIEQAITVLNLNPIKALKLLSVISSAIEGRETGSPKYPMGLQIDITDKCNFSCIMCDRGNLKNIRGALGTDFDYPTFERLAKEIRPLYVALSGLGEPLMNPDIQKYLRFCREAGITSFMPTNMSLMDDRMAEEILRYPPSVLTFSFHGATESSFAAITGTNDFKRCVNNFESLLEKLDRKKTRIRIICALQAKNMRDYDAMYDLLKKWNMVDNLSLTPLVDTQAPGIAAGEVLPPEAKKDLVLREIETSIYKSGDSRRKLFLKKWKESIEDIKGRDEISVVSPCIAPWYSTYITSKGDVLPCCHLTCEKYIMGNINKEPFPRIWNNEAYRNFRKTLRDCRNRIQDCYRCRFDNSDIINNFRFLSIGRIKWKL